MRGNAPVPGRGWADGHKDKRSPEGRRLYDWRAEGSYKCPCGCRRIVQVTAGARGITNVTWDADDPQDKEDPNEAPSKHLGYFCDHCYRAIEPNEALAFFAEIFPD